MKTIDKIKKVGKNTKRSFVVKCKEVGQEMDYKCNRAYNNFKESRKNRCKNVRIVRTVKA